jgi:hypothetical protein
MLGATHLTPKLLTQHLLNLEVTRRDQQILDLEAERQHLKQTLEVIVHNPDFKHKLQLQYLGVEPPVDKPVIPKTAAKKSKQKSALTQPPEAVKFKESDSELSQIIFKSVSTTRLPIPADPWYFEIASWLAKPEVSEHINLWGIGLLGAAFALLHPGKIPSFLEIIVTCWQSLRSRYGKPTA